jgi:CO dehydrogenase/acetyl-CoA synthase alpha subunit
VLDELNSSLVDVPVVVNTIPATNAIITAQNIPAHIAFIKASCEEFTENYYVNVVP